VTLFSDDARSDGVPREGDPTRIDGLEPDGGAWGEASETAPAPRSRRIGAALIVAAFVLLLVTVLSPAPYVIEAPGPVFNTLGYNHPVGQRPANADEKKPLIVVSGHTTYPTKGSLDLLTVSEIGNPDQLPNWGEVIQAWFAPSRAVIPVDVAYPPGQNVQDQNAENAQLMTDSQKDAVAAALNQLGYRFEQHVVVKQVADGPAKGILDVGDEILSVNGVEVKGVQSLRDQLKKNGAGTAATLAIERSGTKKTVTVTPEAASGTVVIGIGAQMEYHFPFDVKIQLDNVGGPSAGQMFALGIMDKLTPDSLNGGARVAGTGTIDNEGNIGAIGGIRQKMYAARGAGATVFLAPRSNCDEVTGHIPSGLHVYAVKTLSESVKVLDAVRTDSGTAQLPTCPAS
jgi:PDZ domain-containing protein